ncbi:probable serine/threonine-protein kinase MARK-C [Chrysoperla carnea]|uniref:probable serine/threonine-protein kinase MARK-C n=1 Tax=Chrysoperla carnea TaxID=189513 RepID=UPI001D082E90|nr:probable serine/threonine-protein kinase MARK-C [Chrysoperla carnea]
MVVGEANINNIMSGIESTGGVRLHNHRKKLKQRFDIIKKLGQGTYGKVQLGINKETGQEVAIKTIKKCKIETEADLIRIRREIQIMSSVQHPNIIHIYEVFENREKMVLVMEYAAGGELYDYLSERKVLLEEEARRIFRQIATAVYYCHKHKICHRDLKLENILLDENGNAKIADFGLSNVFDETRLLSTFCGSPLYASPEIVKGTPYHGPEVDCWSLGVLLYTLVYGAMPFDGSNFKRLVKQISQGDYFEPKTPSPASPLIREMLTVSASRRADMEKICSHWWVNEGHDESCLDIAEDLANQTPVRLDLLLSIAPPPPQIGSDKLVIASAENVAENETLPDANVPARSQSVGSIMERAPTQKIRDIVEDDTNTSSPKRKLEVTVSTENANQASSGAKRKERSRKKDRDSSVDRRSHRSSSRSKADKIDTTAKLVEEEQNSPSSDTPTANELQKNLTITMEVESQNGDLPIIDNKEESNLSVSPPQEEGAMCTELIEEANKKSIASREKRKSVKSKKPKPEIIENKIIEESDVENLPNENNVDKENITNEKQIKSTEDVPKVSKKKVLGDNNEAIPDEAKETEVVPQSPTDKNEVKLENGEESAEKNEEIAQPPTKPIERRRSKIFETAEKFQNMASSNDQKTNLPEKPKKIFIPGVNVGGFKQAFERRASLTNSSPVKTSLSKKTVLDENKKPAEVENADKVETKPVNEVSPVSNEVSPTTDNSDKSVEDEKREMVKHAVSVISNAIDREGARKSKSRPTMIRKPPVPFGVSGRSASGGIANLVSPLSPPGHDNKRQFKLQVGPEMRTATVQVTTPEDTKYIQETIQKKGEADKSNLDEDSDTKTSSIEVNLKSATLPRRKTSKAEITLSYPQPKPATMEFKTEMQHRIDNSHPRLKTQRSEVAFPVSAAPHLGFRSTSLEPEKTKERIIPIALEEESPSGMRSPPTKPPAPRVQRTFSQGQRASSVSRQSTQDSDTDSTSTQQEPIRKSPREFIIPIAIEGGGYVTPRAGSLEPSESGTPTSKFSSTSRFGRPRRMNSLLSDRDGSEDESPFSTLHRHGSVGRDSDNEDSRKDRIHLHRLRSTRPNKRLEHADSLSSGEEDDDDGFELLTAENLFSTLLSRVRSLTQRLNVEDGGRPGFPSSRLLSHFGRDNFWDNLHSREPFRNSFGRSFSREREPQSTEANNGLKQAPWRRTSTSRFSTDSNSGEATAPATTTSQTLPRAAKIECSKIDRNETPKIHMIKIHRT